MPISMNGFSPITACATNIPLAGPVAIPIIAWVPGWTGATGTDDWVARWVAAVPDPFGWDLVAIEPAAGNNHDEVTEIDAIKAVRFVPEPVSSVLLGIGLAGLVLRRKAA